jgi:hypothetical protein
MEFDRVETWVFPSVGRNRVDRSSAMLMAEAPSENSWQTAHQTLSACHARHPWILGFQVDFAMSAQGKDW